MNVRGITCVVTSMLCVAGTLVAVIWISVLIRYSDRSDPDKIQTWRKEYEETWSSHPYGSVNIGQEYDVNRSGTNITCAEYLFSEDMVYDHTLSYLECVTDQNWCPQKKCRQCIRTSMSDQCLLKRCSECPFTEMEDKQCQMIHRQLDEERCKEVHPGFYVALTVVVIAFILFVCWFACACGSLVYKPSVMM